MFHRLPVWVFAAGLIATTPVVGQNRQEMQVLIASTMANGLDYDMGRLAQAMEFSCGENKDKQHCPAKQMGEKVPERPDDIRSINVFATPDRDRTLPRFIVVLTVSHRKEHNRLFFLTSEEGTLQKAMITDQITRKPTLVKPDEYLDQYKSEVSRWLAFVKAQKNPGALR
ncbi:MAG TPA: hypothetical protein VGF08_02815 [Terriglobales bacterium]|jgi:hypothetical protein